METEMRYKTFKMLSEVRVNVSITTPNDSDALVFLMRTCIMLEHACERHKKKKSSTLGFLFFSIFFIVKRG